MRNPEVCTSSIDLRSNLLRRCPNCDINQICHTSVVNSHRMAVVAMDDPRCLPSMLDFGQIKADRLWGAGKGRPW